MQPCAVCTYASINFLDQINTLQGPDVPADFGMRLYLVAISLDIVRNHMQ